MSSTHLSLHYHVIFSTKHRKPLMLAEWRPRLFEFLGGIIRTAGGIPEAIGGTEDHVHLLIGLRATHQLSDVMRELKSSSSKWVHETLGARGFGWQDGYGAFTVSASLRDVVKDYITRQEEHHRKQDSLSEYIELLKKSGVPYDPKFVE